MKNLIRGRISRARSTTKSSSFWSSIPTSISSPSSRPGETILNCLCNRCYLKNKILGLDMNLIDLDPHLHLNMATWSFYAEAAVGQRKTTLKLTGSVSPTKGSAPVFTTATPAICAWTRESLSPGWYIVTPICYYSPAERLRWIARYTSHLMKVRLGSIGMIAEPNVGEGQFEISSQFQLTRRSSWFQKQG